MEFEHLKKDEHPDPPLRALPEHSIAGEKEAGASHAPLGSDGANDGPAEKDFATSQSTLPEGEQVQAVGDEVNPTQSAT